MSKVLGFRIEYEGAAEMLDISQRLEQELKGAADQLERFNRLSSQLKKAKADYQDILKALREIEKGGKSGSGGKKGNGPLPDTDKIKTVTQQIRELNRELAKGPVKGEAEYKKLISRVAELKAQQKGVRDEVRKQQKAFEEIKAAQGSYRQLSATLARLRNEYKDLGEEARDSVAGRDLLRQIDQLDRKLKGLDSQMGVYSRNVGNYRDAIRGLSRAVQTLSALSIAGVGLREIAEANAEVSDSIADVRKTTGLTTDLLKGYGDIVEGLSDQLETLDTRTSLDDLLQISAGGGQLGILAEITNQIRELQQAKADAEASGDTDLAEALGLNIEQRLAEAQTRLFDFTKAVDTIGVALGDELPGDAREITVELTKLSETLGISAERGEALDVSILRTGSTINTLSAQTRAGSASILDFAKRLAGTAAQANISLPEIAGIGATLDAAGISAEVSGTAISRFLADIPKDAERFAQVAGVPLEEFNQLLREDSYEAFRQVLEGAQSSEGGLASLADVLEKAGINSARAGAVINALTSNLGELDKNVNLANQAFEDGNSVVDEFNVKNQTLGAELDKLRNTFINLVVDSGFQNFLAKSVSGVITFIGVLAQLPKFIKDNRAALIALGVALISFNATNIAAAAINLKRLATEKLLPAALRLTAAAQRGLNTALKANPIGIVIGLVFALAAGLKFLYDNVEPVRTAIDNATKRFLEFYESNVFVKRALFFIIEPLKILRLAIRDGADSFYGFRAAAIAVFENIKAAAGEFVTSIEIFFKQLEDKITFSDSGQAKVDAELAALRQRRDEYAAAGTDVGKAYQDAVNAAREESAKNAAEIGPLSGTPSITGSGGSGGNDNYTSPEARDKAIQDQLAALKKLRDLRAELIEDETQRQVQQELNSLADEVADLIGDPQTVNEQAALLAQTTVRAIEGIYEDARAANEQQALEALDSLGEGGGLLPSPEALDAQGEEIRQRLQQQNDALFDQQVRALENAAALAVAQLEGTPEMIAQQTEQIYQGLQEQLAVLELAREQESDIQLARQQERDARLTDLKLQSLEQRYEREIARTRELEAAKLEALNEQAAQGGMTPEEIEMQRAAIRQEVNDLLIELEENYYSRRGEIAQEGGEDIIDREQQLADRRVKRAEQTTDELIRQAERLRKAEQASTDASLGTLQNFVGATKSILQEDEANRKKYASTLKALAVAEIGINLIREIQAIAAANSTYPEPFGSIIKGASIAKAIATAAVGLNKVKNQEFALGDTLFVGYEGGGSTPGGSPGGSGLSVQGPGTVPAHGVTQGPGHIGGGIKAVNKFGDLVELEGNEFAMRNGPFLHIINRRSTQKFRHRLESMRRPNSAVYDHGIAQMASQINSYKGWGKAFAASGGSFGVLDAPVVPFPTPSASVPQTQEAGLSQESVSQFSNMIQILDKKTDAINGRIDRLQVVSDPDEIVRGATNRRNQKRTS